MRRTFALCSAAGAEIAAPRRSFLRFNDIEIHVREWGDASSPVILCWHGLGRTGSDIAPLATALSSQFRVISPDLPGRGLSSWMRTTSEYAMGSMEGVAERIVESVVPPSSSFRVLGTSMGGMLGIALAGGAMKSRVSHLLINDIGPEVPQPAIDRILNYSRLMPEFHSISELEGYLRLVYAPYGDMSNAEWTAMAISSHRRCDDGKVTLHYDPKIISALSEHSGYRCWDRYKTVQCKMLILRGEHSDVLPMRLAAAMLRHNSNSNLCVLPNCGHAPALNTSKQTDVVREFFSK